MGGKGETFSPFHSVNTIAFAFSHLQVHNLMTNDFMYDMSRKGLSLPTVNFVYNKMAPIDCHNVRLYRTYIVHVYISYIYIVHIIHALRIFYMFFDIQILSP